jgi:hypothetical protein
VDEAWGGAISYLYHVECLVPAAGATRLAAMKAADLAPTGASDVPPMAGADATHYAAVKARLLGFLSVAKAGMRALLLDLFFLTLLAALVYWSYARLSPFAGTLVGFWLVCGIAFWLSGATPGLRQLRIENPLSERRPPRAVDHSP